MMGLLATDEQRWRSLTEIGGGAREGLLVFTIVLRMWYCVDVGERHT